MPIRIDYSEDFERVWRAYPDWIKGRSKKKLSYDSWQKLVKEGLDQTDVEEILTVIEQRKRRDERWQPGNQFGYQGLQVWLNQRGWMEEYQTIKRSPAHHQIEREPVDEREEYFKFLSQMKRYGKTFDELRSEGHAISEDVWNGVPREAS